MPTTEVSTIEESKQPASLVARMLIARGAREKAVDRLIEGMDAEVSGNRGPDHRSRRDAAMAALAYMDGRPIEMIYQVTEKRTVAPTAAQLLSNPAAVEAVARAMLADPESRKALAAALQAAEGAELAPI